MALVNGQNKRPVKTVNRANSKSLKDNKDKSDSNKKITVRNNATKKAEVKQAKNEEPEDYGIKDEIAILVAFACAAILVLSNFDLAGSVGRAIKWLMFGFIGVMEYFFPFVVAGTIIFISVNRKLIKVARVKAVAVYCLMVVFAAMWQRITNVPAIEGGIFSFFKICASKKIGGGFFGGLLCKILYPLGTVGSFVIMIILMIICIVVITEKSFIKGVINAKSKSKEIIRNAKEEYVSFIENTNLDNEVDDDDLEEFEENIKEEKTKSSTKNRISRMGKKVRGVTSDILLQDNGSDKESDIDIDSISAIPQQNDEYSNDIYEPDDYNQVFTEFSDGANAHNESNGIEQVDIENNEQMAHANANDVDIIEAGDTISEYSNYDNENVAADIAKVETSKRADISDVYGTDKAKSKEAFSNSNSKKYSKPDINCLFRNKKAAILGSSTGKNDETAKILKQTLLNFGVAVEVVGISYGPAVTRYEIQPEQGVKVSKIVSLSDDIKLSLAAADIRIEAPIPGKSAIGIEVPNKEPATVGLRELIESKEFKNSKSKLVFAAGRDIAGKVILSDIAKMPHLLIAGATGSGKSVCINTIITSILYNASPDDVRMILIDPKVVELSAYNGIPHLAEKVVTDPKEAAKALNWAVIEMDRRYKDFAKYGVRNLDGFNEKIKRGDILDDNGDVVKNTKPQILIIIDELADLMMVSANEVEDAICRLAQLARAAGIHMVIATQRPSVNVVTGLIKANVPSRIAFAVSSGVDSRTILDMNGAEKLLGKGDMLYFPSNIPKPVRVQGAFVSDEEVATVVDDVKRKNEPVVYDDSISKTEIGSAAIGQSSPVDDRDSLFVEAGRFVIENEKGSIGMLQRHFKIGFNRAGRIMDQLFEAGVVGQEMGTKPRKIEMSITDFEKMVSSNKGESA